MSYQLLALALTVPYLGIIYQTADMYDLDTVMIIAQIRAESGFKHNAVSPVGAVGLMQVMPSTAKWLGFPHKPAQLMNPALNVRIGCHYDAYLRAYWSRKGFRGYMLDILMLSSYNAGPGRVRRAIRQGNLDELRLPKETRGYIRRIARYRVEYLYTIIKRLAQ